MVGSMPTAFSTAFTIARGDALGPAAARAARARASTSPSATKARAALGPLTKKLAGGGTASPGGHTGSASLSGRRVYSQGATQAALPALYAAT